jgi:hypothetical protein
VSDLRGESAPDPRSDLAIPLLSRRRERGQTFQKIQHAVPAVALLGVGLQGLRQGGQGVALALALAELGTSLLLLISLARALAAAHRSGRGTHTVYAHGVDWFDIFAAGVLAVEALERWHTHHHLPRPTLLLAAVTLALGLFHGRLSGFKAQRRVLRLGPDGIRVRARFRHFSAAWRDVARIDLDEREARIVARDGRERRIDLADLRNAAEVRAALEEARSRLA